jgi:hypothetical protein
MSKVGFGSGTKNKNDEVIHNRIKEKKCSKQWISLYIIYLAYGNKNFHQTSN